MIARERIAVFLAANRNLELCDRCLARALGIDPSTGYRAAVKVESDGSGRAQMWLRVDLESSGTERRTGFFDNMDDRPITADAWEYHEIVGDVAKDARSIALGVMTLGPCLVLVDDASFEVVDAAVPSTVAAAPSASADAAVEPFFTAWLWLPAIAVALFAAGYLVPGRFGKRCG